MLRSTSSTRRPAWPSDSGAPELAGSVRFHCSACGFSFEPCDPYPFRCPQQAPGDDMDHLIEARVDFAEEPSLDPTSENPFLRYREWLPSYHVACEHGLDDAGYCKEVLDLEEEILHATGQRFRKTPLVRADDLGQALGLAEGAQLWIKDETRNIGESHKARHLFGVILHLQLVEELGWSPSSSRPHLAVASCGNAAYSAALLGRATGFEVDVFVPDDADPEVVQAIREQGGTIHPCAAPPERRGDPCVTKFREAVAEGAIPLSCQGPENGLVIDGGATLGWEVMEEAVTRSTRFDGIFIPVGGGALASAFSRALRSRGWRSPGGAVHAVQPQGCHPLRGAYLAFAQRLLGRAVEAAECLDGALAAELRDVPANKHQEEQTYSARHRAESMRPWPTPPVSVARGILDDETYDWRAVVDGMITSGGGPIVVEESSLREANELTHEHVGLCASHTGSASVAGLLELARSRAASGKPLGGTHLVLCTGVR